MNWILQVLGFGGEIVKARRDLKVAKIEAKAEAVRQTLSNEGAWEQITATNAASGWSDELWTLVLVALVLSCFIPGSEELVDNGLARLDNFPDWVKWCVGASVSFAFGRKVMPGWFSKR